MSLRFLFLTALLLPAPGLAVNFDTPADTSPRLYARGLDSGVRWSLRVGAFSQRDAAEAMLNELRRLGQSPRIYTTQCEGLLPQYNVLIGSFADLRQAETAAAWRDLPGFSMNVVRIAARDTSEVVTLDKADCPRPRLPPRNPDDEPPDDRFSVTWLDRPLYLGGKYTLSSSMRKDFRLYSQREDDQWRSSNELQAEVLYEFSDEGSVYFEFSATYDRDLYAEDDDTDSFSEFERGESWVYWQHLGRSDYGLQVGRITVQETREWWWDEDLDAVRLHYANGRSEFSLVLAQQMAPVSTRDDGIDPESKDVLRLLGEWDWEYREDHHLGLFVLGQYDHSAVEASGTVIDEADEDEIDTDAIWLGTRLIGRWKTEDWGRLYYWGDFALLHGRESVIDFDDFNDDGSLRVADDRETTDLRSWAYDLGLVWQTPWLDKSWLALGYAEGSGDDDPNDDVDANFHQTGINDNSQRLRGVSRFYYYGEMFRPELSNMRILTAAVGMEVGRDASIDLVWHDYSQVVADDRIRDTRLSGDADNPNGVDRDLGREIDIIFGKEWKNLELDLALGVFEAGKALRKSDDPDDDRDLDKTRAWILSMELEYSF